MKMKKYTYWEVVSEYQLEGYEFALLEEVAE